MAIGYILLAVAIAAFLYWLYSTGDNSLRIQAGKRILFGVPFLALMFAIGILFSAYITLTFTADTLWQFTTGRQGFAPGGDVERLWNWKDRNTRWVVTGAGSPQLLP